MGQAPAGKDCNKTGRGTPFVKAGEFGEMRPIIREWTTDPKKLGKRSDVFVCVVGATCGKINLGEDCAIGRSVAALRPKPEVLDQFYLHYYLHGTVEKLRSGSLGSAQTVISKNMLAELPIPLPPLEEQKRIVAVLDQAFAALDRARAHAEANLADAEEVFPSLLDEVFAREDWPEVELQVLVDENCSLSYGIVQPGNDVENGLPIVRPVDLDRDEIGLEGLKRINPHRATSYSRTQLDGTELLLCVRGTTGTISLASDEVSGANVTRGIVPIRFNGQMHRLFGFYQFRSRRLQRQIAAKTYGAALMQINIRDVKKLRLRCPPMSEQIAAVERMAGVGAAHGELMSAAKSKLAELEDLRQSLLQKAFSGEL
jgi:type I restriction enzyme, S subunit